MTLPKKVKLVEVGPRDGLQNEAAIIPVNTKIDFINRLTRCGHQRIEAGSFVSPEWVPQMADTGHVLRQIERTPHTCYSVLVPNVQGFQNAVDAHVDEVAVFTAASETFSHKNTNCSIEESLHRFEQVITLAKTHDISVRGYISCAYGCPYEGEITLAAVTSVAERLYSMGCYEIAIADTVGTATPRYAQKVIEVIAKKIPMSKLAVHFHDTYGQALANIYAVLEIGIATIDCAVAGLGGCPYAKGAAGNVASEEVLYLLNGLGISTGVKLDDLIKAGEYICQFLDHRNQSKVALATLSRINQ